MIQRICALLLTLTMLAALPAFAENGTDWQAWTQNGLAAQGSGEEGEAAVYTIIFDLNTTPDSGDDETYRVETMAADGNTPVPDVETPVREGYHFAGWQSVPELTENDFEFGVSKYLVPLRSRLLYGGAGTDVSSLADSENVVRLYARWVKEVEISTPDELAGIENDLYGYYVLTEDIDLSGRTWKPIGRYFGNYETWNPEFWTYAFHGTLDGNGHKITGLTITDWEMDTAGYKESASWHNDGDNADGTLALFGAIANANICNLIIEDAVISTECDGNCAVYAAPLAAFDMASTVQNVHVLNPQVSVVARDHGRTFAYVAVSGLIAGGWNDYILNCEIAGGSISVDGVAEACHGGDYFVGGILGECYSNIHDSYVQTDISVHVMDISTAEEDSPLEVFVGGVNGSNTTCSNTTADTRINVSVNKPMGVSDVSIGGFTGSQRYQMATDCVIKSEITTENTLDPELGRESVGSVTGSFNIPFLTITMMYTPEDYAGFRNMNAEATWNGNALVNKLGRAPAVDGEPITYIAFGDHEKDGVTYPANSEAVGAAYNCQIFAFFPSIVWIVTE